MRIRRFYPSAAKAIADSVLAEILNDQVYDEEDAKNWSMDISDKIRESVTGEDLLLAISVNM